MLEDASPLRSDGLTRSTWFVVAHQRHLSSMWPAAHGFWGLEEGRDSSAGRNSRRPTRFSTGLFRGALSREAGVPRLALLALVFACLLCNTARKSEVPRIKGAWSAAAGHLYNTRAVSMAGIGDHAGETGWLGGDNEFSEARIVRFCCWRVRCGGGPSGWSCFGRRTRRIRSRLAPGPGWVLVAGPPPYLPSYRRP